MSENSEEKTIAAIVRGPNAPTVYIEGVAQVQLGYPMCRVHLHSAVEQMQIEGGVQSVRQLGVELVMTTGALIEMISQLSKTVTDGSPQLLEFVDLNTKRVLEELNKIKNVAALKS